LRFSPLGGVSSVEGDQPTMTVTVQFDPGRATLARIGQAMAEEGYTVEKLLGRQ
jgi:copper chaperone CopZ